MNRATLSWFIIAGVIVAIGILLHAPDAWAIADDLKTGSFSCNGGTASGQLLVSGSSCPTALKFDNLFSFLICNFEQLTSNLMGQMFCGMITNLEPAVWAAASLAIAVFGVSFTIGLIPATGQEAMMFIIKIALITAFATQADYLIGTAYTFIVVAMREGTTIVLTTMNASGINSGADVYGEVDKLMATIFRFATDPLNATSNDTFCKNAVFAVIALMAAALPIVAYVALLLIGRMVLTLFRSVFAYVYALMGVTFLLTLAPFFLSFFLFKQTRNLFDRWIGYLASFTLQVVLLFAFLTFIVLMVKDVSQRNIAADITAIIMPSKQEKTIEGTSLRSPLSFCTICDFEVVDRDSGAVITSKDENYIKNGKLKCKKDPGEPIEPNFASSPDNFKNPDGTPKKDSPVYAIVALATQGLLSVVIIILIIEKLLTLLPSLAQRLASGLGATYATQLGGGQATASGGVTRLPGESFIDDFKTGFTSGFRDAKGADGKYSSDSISKTLQGVKDGFAGMISGRTSDGRRLDGIDRPDDDEKNPNMLGAKNSFKRWLSDPSRFGQ